MFFHSHSRELIHWLIKLCPTFSCIVRRALAFLLFLLNCELISNVLFLLSYFFLALLLCSFVQMSNDYISTFQICSICLNSHIKFRLIWMMSTLSLHEPKAFQRFGFTNNTGKPNNELQHVIFPWYSNAQKSQKMCTDFSNKQNKCWKSTILDLQWSLAS